MKLDEPKIVSHHTYRFYVEIDGDGKMIPLEQEEPLLLNSHVQLIGILKALRYLLDTSEGESILYRCAMVMRRYREFLPQFRNDSSYFKK